MTLLPRLRVPRAHPSVARRQRRTADIPGLLGDALLLPLIGAALILGGPLRVSAPAYGTLRESGGPITWGLLMVAGGLVAGAAAWVGARAVGWALRVEASVMVVWALMFGHSALIDPRASPVGTLLGAYVAYQMVMRAETYLAPPHLGGDRP